jgi:hypothetical protein
MLSLDDETLPIINKPKYPPPKRREENKEQNGRVLGFGVSSLQREPTKHYWQPKQQPYIGYWLHS